MEDNNIYKIILLNKGKCTAYSLSYENPLNYLSEIEEDLTVINFTGVIHIDLLLSNGLTSNRFLSANVKDGSIARESIMIEKNVSLEIINAANSFYLTCSKLLHNGILSNDDILTICSKKITRYSATN